MDLTIIECVILIQDHFPYSIYKYIYLLRFSLCFVDQEEAWKASVFFLRVKALVLMHSNYACSDVSM